MNRDTVHLLALPCSKRRAVAHHTEHRQRALQDQGAAGQPPSPPGRFDDVTETWPDSSLMG